MPFLTDENATRYSVLRRQALGQYLPSTQGISPGVSLHQHFISRRLTSNTLYPDRECCSRFLSAGKSQIKRFIQSDHSFGDIKCRVAFSPPNAFTSPVIRLLCYSPFINFNELVRQHELQIDLFGCRRHSSI
jgi:hypothetical protein